MVGVLCTLLIAIGAAGVGRLLLFKAAERFDPAARFGVSGVLGLGTLGLLTLLIESIPGAISGGGIVFLGVYVLVGFAELARRRSELKLAKPEGMALLSPLVVTLGALFALVSVLAPSDINDWDTLAYHLAVPKLWLEAGRAYSVPFIHHSNFPFAVDNLYLWGLRTGGESGAKAFELAFYLFGAFLVFGLARQRKDVNAGWWAMAAYATIPVVMWEAGSAYIDVAHGLFTAIGVFSLALAAEDKENRALILPAALGLGLAAGSKYTGLQAIAAIGFASLVLILLKRAPGLNLGSWAAAMLLSGAVAAPWYVRNAINVGNPVFPFFYEQLGGKNWDQRRADIYRNEQQSFGVGQAKKGREATAIGHGVLGLAYQPGRYINPAQNLGMGSPLGSVGFVTLAILATVAILGGLGTFEAAVLGFAGISLLLWFFLSQQSRYIVPVAIPATVLGASLFDRKQVGVAVKAGIAIQALYSVYLVNLQLVQSKLPVVMGRISPEDYRKATVPFAEAARSMNESVKPGKVALYDEVFGYLLDVPYFWANPGHSTLIPYDEIDTPEQYVEALSKLGITHVYVSLSPVVKERQFAGRWVQAMQGTDFAPEERKALWDNWETRWHVLVSDSVRAGKLTVVQQYRSGLLFQVQKG